MYKKLVYYILGKSNILRFLNRDKFVILTYHRVLDEYRGIGGMVVLKKEFEKQIKYISENYNVINFKDLADIIKCGVLKKNSIIITFDDGYKDIIKNAYPILKKYNVKATLFITSDFADGKTPWWEKDNKNMLKWKDIKNLDFEIGAHSVSHPVLSKLDDEKLKNEIINCKRDIENKLYLKVNVFSYPHGKREDIGKKAIWLVKENYDFGVSNIYGVNDLNSNPHYLKRINVFWNDINIFKVKVRGMK